MSFFGVGSGVFGAFRVGLLVPAFGAGIRHHSSSGACPLFKLFGVLKVGDCNVGCSARAFISAVSQEMIFAAHVTDWAGWQVFDEDIPIVSFLQGQDAVWVRNRSPGFEGDWWFVGGRGVGTSPDGLDRRAQSRLEGWAEAETEVSFVSQAEFKRVEVEAGCVDGFR